ncbi:LutC/YkgG family protein [Knoellia sp. CPCC 206453]|uniref:LutC/YkgG family protein n=1 Tax=Knoellia pratensis TaxID=3404796 RepID=UPI00361A0E7E
MSLATNPTTSARAEILANVRSATADITTEPRLRAPHGHDDPRGARPHVSVRGTKSLPRGETLDLLAENVADYRATVLRVPEAEVGAAIVGALRAVDASSVVLPTGLDDEWQQAVREAFDVVAESGSTTLVLDSVDAVVTGSAVGIATTGTIVLDHGPDQGRRALTLVPDTHVCVIRDAHVVHDVPEAVARLRTATGQQRALTWISGPSATSDIELQRVEGVHGPRNLVVIIVATEIVAKEPV